MSISRMTLNTQREKQAIASKRKDQLTRFTDTLGAYSKMLFESEVRRILSLGDFGR
jgi:hypothetical protein